MPVNMLTDGLMSKQWYVTLVFMNSNLTFTTKHAWYVMQLQLIADYH